MKKLLTLSVLFLGIFLFGTNVRPGLAATTGSIAVADDGIRCSPLETGSADLKTYPFSQKPEDPALTRSTLSEEERLLGLSLLWSETRFSFAYFDRIAPVWDSLYLQFMPRVRKVRTDFEYYLELKRFLAHIADGHSGVFWPKEIDQALGYPPLEIRKIEGRAVVFRLLHESEELKRNRIQPGPAIVEVDGQPVGALAAAWRELMTGSTQQATDRLDYFRILTGPRNSAVEVVLEEPGGARRKVSLTRSEPYFGDLNLDPIQYYSTRHLGPGLEYFQANQMNDDVGKAFEDFIGTHPEMNGLILDLRYNGGGSDLVSFDMISRLIDKPLPSEICEVTSYRADKKAEHEGQDIIRTMAPEVEPFKGHKFTGWLVVMIGEQSGSATEGGFLSVIRNRPMTILAGETTAGSTGMPMVFKLPGGGVGCVCSRRTLGPDGKAFVGVGIQPDIRTGLTQNDLFQGNDSVLEKAIGILREKATGRT
jgi:carboxyl-terminal processing protease